MLKRSGFFVYALCCWWPASAQQSDTTVQLAPVQVEVDRPVPRRQTALFSISPDSLLMRSLPAASVADWLAWQGSSSVRSYGPAGLATLSVRGSSSQQNAVLWDGLSLLSPLNATPDLNLLPMWLFGDIQLQLGSASADFGSGAIGGALHLGQLVPQQHGASAFTEWRSFGDRSAGLALSWRGKQWWYSVRGLYRQADNDFEYQNIAKFGAPTERQLHAATRMGGVLQELGWQPRPKHRLKLRWWRQAHDRQLPPSMTVASSTAEQADTANRVFLSWEYLGNQRQWSLRTAYLNELNHYADVATNLDERHRFEGWLQEFKWLEGLKNGQQLDFLVQQSLYTASSPNYSGRQQQHRLAFLPGWRLERPRFTSQVRLRADWVDGQAVPLTPSLQHEQRLGGGYQLNAALSRNFRLPTLNDLYWQPGGNAALKPELGWSSELAVQKQGFFRKNQLKARLGAFYHEVDNWIIWLPNASLGYWSPRNVRQVRSWGLEQQLQWAKNFGKLQLRAQVDYALVHATNQAAAPTEAAILGKQLIYVPRHQWRGQIFVQRGPSFIGWQFGYQGLRYTSSDNQAFLPGYEQSSLLLGTDFRHKKQLFRLNAGIHNLFNTTYQAVAWRPMPGRHFHLNFTYHLQ